MQDADYIRQLFDKYRTVPWAEDYYDMTDFEVTLSAWAVTGAPRHRQQENLLRNVAGLVGIGKGYGRLHEFVMPAEFVYLWACLRASLGAEVNSDRAREWGYVIDQPKSEADIDRYVREVRGLRELNLAQLGDVKSWYKLWELNVDVAYLYSRVGHEILASKGNIETKIKVDQKTLLQMANALHQEWTRVRVYWEKLIQTRAEFLTQRRAPIHRLQAYKRQRDRAK